MNVPLEALIPELHINKQVDMALLPGTPMMPDKPAIAIWYRNPLVKDGGLLISSTPQDRMSLPVFPSLLAIMRYQPIPERWSLHVICLISRSVPPR